MAIRKKQLKEILSEDIDDIIDEGKGKGKYPDGKKDIKENDDEDEDDDEDTEEEDKKVKKEEIEQRYENLKEKNNEEISKDFFAILSNEANLSEEFVKKSKLIFETALKVHISNEAKKLEELSEDILEEKLKESIEDLTDGIDKYLNKVVEEYLDKNELAIDAGIKTEISESLLSDIKNAFEKHNVLIPENEDDIVEKLSEEAISLEETLDVEIERNIQLSEELVAHKKAGVLHDMSENLADTEIEKLIELSKSVEFDSEEDFRDSMVTLKESYFNKSTKPLLEDIDEDISKGTNKYIDNDSNEILDPNVARYVQQISKMQKNSN